MGISRLKNIVFDQLGFRKSLLFFLVLPGLTVIVIFFAIHRSFTEIDPTDSSAKSPGLSTLLTQLQRKINFDPQAPPISSASAPVGSHALIGLDDMIGDEPGPTPDARVLVGWITRAHDNAGQFYTIVDKRQARVMLFSARGNLIASAPALLGKALGDDSAPGIGDKPLALILDEEKTTPAGRFVSEPGFNADGEDVIWVDYQAAVSMHRVRATRPAERRIERLESPSPLDNRISFGCINVPAAFFDLHVKPILGRAQSLVYVLPETRSLAAQFPSLSP